MQAERCPPRQAQAPLHKRAPELQGGEGREGGRVGPSETQLCEGTVRPPPAPAAMTTPSGMASRNKLLIMDTASLPPQSPSALFAVPITLPSSTCSVFA